MCLAVNGRILAIHHRPPEGAESHGHGADSGTAGRAEAAPLGMDSCGSEAQTSGEDCLWRVAEVDFGGVRQMVSLACLPEARVGDQVLVHVGIALSLVE